MIAAIIATLVAGAQPQLGYLTAGELADRCNDASASSASYCYAYIAAVHDMMRAYEVWLGQKEFCPPVRISQGDLRKDFIGYLLAYPANRTGLAASVVTVALKESYPCDYSGPSTPPAGAPPPVTKTLPDPQR